MSIKNWLQNLVFKFKKEKKIEDYMIEKNIIKKKMTHSPSGRYKMEIIHYTTGKNTWNYTRGIVKKVSDESIVCDIPRNYSIFHHSFVKKDEQEYLLCGKHYMQQTIVNLDTGEEKTYNGDGFCWVPSSKLSPDGKTLMTSGCYWAGPYELRFWDFTDPMKSLEKLDVSGEKEDQVYLHDYNGYGNYKEHLEGWIDKDTFSYIEFCDDGSFFVPLQKFDDDISLDELDLFPTKFEKEENFKDGPVLRKTIKRNGNIMEIIKEEPIHLKDNFFITPRQISPENYISCKPVLVVSKGGGFEKGVKMWVLNPSEIDLKNLDILSPIFHRENDEPAIEWINGAKFWYKYGKLHRDGDKPAKDFPSGTKIFYKNGLLHRENDLPAIEFDNGTKEWWVNGKLHRENDLPAREYSDGSKSWYKNGNLHRDNDKPAIVYSRGTKCWYEDGKLVRFENAQ